MKDFNFFSPYQLEKRNIRQKKLFIISACSLFIIGLLIFTIFNYFQISRYKSEIDNVQSYLDSDKVRQLVANYSKTKKNTELLTVYYDKAAEIDKYLSQYNAVNSELLTNLTSAMPKDAKLIRLTIKNSDVELNYAIYNLVTAAELEHNLKALDLFNRVHVSVLNTEKNSSAIINCSFKDVNINEAGTDK
jgi:ABC-type Na+ efflux pump permease subunit